MKIDLHIGTLVLERGTSDRGRVAASVREELHRLLLEGGLSPALLEGADIGHLDGGALQVGRDAAPDHLAAGIARAVHRGLSRDQRARATPVANDRPCGSSHG